MKISIRSLGILLSSLFFFLQTQVLWAQEPAAPRSTATTAVAAEPQAAGQIASPSQVVPALPVPRLIKFSGVAKDASGQAHSGTVGITFSIYANQEGGTPLWMETQNLELDAHGHYAVLLGSSQSAGLPLNLFATGEPRWLGAKLELPGEVEQARVLLVSVPYALKASDADTVGGMPASAFVLAPTGSGSNAGAGAPGSAKSKEAKSGAKSEFTSSGTANYIPVFTDSSGDIGDSVIYQSTSGNIGIGYGNPQQRLVIGAPAGGSVLNSSNLSDQDLNLILSAPGASDKYTFFGPSTPTNLTLGVGLKEMMRITSSGNVGIGFSNPQQRLVIGAPAGGSVLNSSNLVDQDLNLILSAPGAADKHTYFGPSVATNLTLGVGLAEMMRITSSGNVGIGTSTPAATLDVHGTGNFTGGVNFGGYANFGSYVEAFQTAGPFNAAVLGWGSNGSVGTFGDSDSGYGLQGQSSSGFGVYGDSTNPADGAAGVLGLTLGAFSTTYSTYAAYGAAGVWGDTAGNNNGFATGVFGTADANYAGIFINNGGVPAVYVENGAGAGISAMGTVGMSAEGSSGNGIEGYSDSAGSGVEGESFSLVSQEAGVLGIGNTTSGTYSAYNIYSGVWGDTGTSSTTVAPAWAIGVLGTADDSHAGVFLNNSAGWSTMYISNAGSGGIGNAVPAGLFATLNASTPTGTCGIGGNGDLTCTGQVKTLATTSGGARKVETYAMQSPENWMEDFGSGALQGGVAVVNIDPAFAETVSGTANYHVFITPNGDSKGLYVIRKTAASFQVRESDGGTSSLSFDYRIVAKRRGYEAQRLTDVTERFNTEQKALDRHLNVKSGAAHSRPGQSPLVPKTNSTPRRRTASGSPHAAVRRPAPATHP